MQKYQVTKVIEFAYGHRLLDHDGKCKYLHGHNGMLEVDVAADELDAMGMVIDFGKVNDVVRNWVNEHLDHRMLLQEGDPAIPGLEALGEPLVLIPVKPTAENIARLIWDAAREAGLSLSEVRLWETSTSRATYRGQPVRE
jgi:6-pyruvoyltetrahydropterin/6-carboxytetrahydropterin synthase